MAAITNTLVSIRDLRPTALSGGCLRSSEQSLVSYGPINLSLGTICWKKAEVVTYRSCVTVQAAYSNGGKPSIASIFIVGFVLGGITAGTLSCVYAPQILVEKIEQLNSVIDNVSSQLRVHDGPNGVAVTSDEVEAPI